ncbi:MAG: two-component regulator propeller domain-containing protein [Candidatus Cryptobacteroides sp.]
MIPFAGLAQPTLRQTAFSYRRVSEGLPQSDVTAIVQDCFGYMWFGTRNGLCRYDGYEFLNFKQDLSDTTTLGCNIIISLAAADNGSVWAGTLKGVDRYNPASGNFSHYSTAINKDNEIEELSRVSEIYYTPGGDICALSDNMICIYDSLTDSFKSFHIPKSPRAMLQAVVSYDDNSLWLGSESGLYLFSRKDGNVRQIIPGRFIEAGDIDQSDIRIYSMTAGESSDELWLGTDKGVLHYSHSDGILRECDCQKFDPGRIETLFKTSDGSIWAGSQSKGLLMVKDDNSISFRHNAKNTQSISSDKILSLTEDRTGVLWIGTLQGGVNKLDYRKRQYTILSPSSAIDDNPVTASCVENDSTLWIGTGNGILERMNLSTGDRKSWKIEFPERAYEYNMDNIMDIDSDGDQLWISTGKGLVCFDKVKERFHCIDIRISTKDSSYLYANLINGTEFDSYGNIWCCSPSGIIIIRDGHLVKIITRGPEEGTLPRNNIQTIYRDHQGEMWVATRNAGLSRFTGTLDKPEFKTYRNTPDENSISGDNICSIFEDSKGRFWIGTWGFGLNLMDRKTGQFKRYTVNDGLLDNVVFGIKEDSKGNLWLSSYGGLTSFCPETGTFSQYQFQRSASLQEAIFSNMEIDGNNRLYICRLDGLMCYDTEFAYPPRNLHKPHITNIDIPSSDRLLEPDDNGTVRLSHSDSHITISFSALDYSEDIRYEYTLEGFDDNWTWTREHKVNYSNLLPGEYSFKVRSSDSYGNTSESPAILRIIVNPPFYRTGLAYGLYSVLFVALILIAILYVRRRNREHETRVEERLRLASEKRLYESKMQFFTNMSHELRTPLTLILGPVSKLKSALGGDDELYPMVDLMSRNGERLLRMVNQLLDFRKAESGNMTPAYEDTDIISLIERVTGYFTDAMSEKGIGMQLNYTERISIQTDPDMLEKILYNLVSNAVKFTNSVISIDVAMESNAVRITVSDNGCGIEPEEADKIFSRFYQSGSGTEEGSGIGLHLSKELARLIGSNLSVSSEKGKGCDFTLELPARNLQVIINEENEDEPKEDGENKMLILVVDDNTEMRFYIKSSLLPDYRVIEAVDGNDCETILKKHVPDLIISDVMMPGKDGIELLKSVKNSRKTYNTPVILVSAKTSEEDRLRGLESGADIYITKPFSGQYLKACVDRLAQTQLKLRSQLSADIMTSPEKIEIVSPAHKTLQSIARAVEKNLSNAEFGVEQLSKEIGLSRMHIYRVLKNMLGETPSEFINDFRLAKAASMLVLKELNVNEIAYMVGFNDPKWFSICFKKKYGQTPTEYSKENSGTEVS